MNLPGNGIFVVKGEISVLMIAMRRGTRWSSHSYQEDDALMKNFQELREILDNVDDLRFVEPITFLSPFLNVIRSEETTGPVTSLALSSVNKFLSYGIIDPMHASIPQAIHNIADAVTHARFVGTDQSSDGVVLMRILQVLRTLTLSPEGVNLTNESLCEIMLSCFRICFETRLSELLRKTAEHYLKDMVHLVFMRLPQFCEDLRTTSIKQFQMRTGTLDQTRTKRKNKQTYRKREKVDSEGIQSFVPPKVVQDSTPSSISSTPLTTLSVSNVVDLQGSILQNIHSMSCDTIEVSELSFPSPVQNEGYISDLESGIFSTQSNNSEMKNVQCDDQISNTTEHNHHVETEVSQINSQDDITKAKETVNDGTCDSSNDSSQEYVNQRGIRFTPQLHQELILSPYGLACARELFRFLISLCNLLDKQNTDVMIHLGLILLTVAFEVGAESIGRYNTLQFLVKDDLCRNLFSLMSTERLSVFAADLQVAFLMFQSQRSFLKYQLEFYLKKLMDILSSDSTKITHEHREIAMENLLQLWRIPGFHTELYLNYDCDLYCLNLFEEFTKLLAKFTFSATNGLNQTQLLSLDALLITIEGIEKRCKEKSKQKILNNEISLNDSGSRENIYNYNRSSKVKSADNVPNKEELAHKKFLKKWLPQGTEYFNQKPKKGIEFLQEHGFLKPVLDIEEIVMFLRENPGLSKAMIGEYISNRSNLKILEAFVKTFNFTDVRIDEALRAFLESFRLPGEAPTISLILEHFADHWHKSNGEPFADVDSAFTLAYAIIMLNVDQHNENAKKQTVPMSASAFKKNLKGVNGGDDFDEELLDEIYNTIKNDEIVMPAEQAGIIRDNYLWKLLLRKGQSKEASYVHENSGTYDFELFQILYGPAVSALSSGFEKSDNPSIYKKIMKGFEQCAFIASNLNIPKSLDMLLLTISKFSLFHNGGRQNNVVIQFGANNKAQLALKTFFALFHLHGNSITEGWKTLFDLMLSLYTNDLLSKTFTEIEDFIEPSGKFVLHFEEAPNLEKQDTGLLSSLYSYMVSAENLSKVPTPEEQYFIEITKECIKDCNLDQLITDSKFLHENALLEMVKTLIELSRGPDIQESLGYNYNQNVTVFFLELLIKIVMQNRDRVMSIWQNVRDHIYTIVMNASLFDYQFLLERSVIGLLRIAIRLMRNEEMSHIVLQSLRMLLLLKSSTLSRISRQISFGLFELLKTSAQNIHTNTDWTIIFTLLECVGAGAQPPKPISEDSSLLSHEIKSGEEYPDNTREDDAIVDRGYKSDSELTKSTKHDQEHQKSFVPVSPLGTPSTGGWILVGNEGEIQPVMGRTVPPTQYELCLEKNLGIHDPRSMMKCCESLAFLVRDVAHITPYNFDICVHCIRTFVEANVQSCNGTKRFANHESRPRIKSNRARLRVSRNRKSPTSSPDEDEESEEEGVPSGYHQISIQLLDLMHTLHTRTAQIFKWWAEEGGEVSQETSLWSQGWCPLLQGIARLCCDSRYQVRTSAITYLQRALLVHDLQTLSGPEWEQCFQRVLFPLLNYLLQPTMPKDAGSMEETRMRAATLLSKVFLHHLTPLSSLSTFSNLWLIILDFMDKYMHADKSDLLYEAIPESLKNMLLVMDSAKVFDGPEGRSMLWNATWERITKFLPELKNDLFREIESESQASVEDKLLENIRNTQQSFETKESTPYSK
nr:Golgi-specific brefeldin A-resistance guanine nucleotide exchange factor 1 [Leptinotarsa decemlineata]